MFVDGYYVGTLSDLSSVVTLAPGAHRVELHADGYEPMTVDVQSTSDRSMTYRATLKPLVPPAPPAAAAGSEPTRPVPATIYMIPGCYVGNLPPREVALPAGCDPSRATVLRP